MVESILTAAARIFAKHGYAKATTNRIAQAAGISVGSLYQYFPSKDAIAVTLLRRYREHLARLVAQRIEEAKTETFAAFVRGLLSDLLQDRALPPGLQRVLIEVVLRTDARREVLGFEEQLEASLAAALRTKTLHPHPEVGAFILVRVMLSVVQGAVADRPQLNTPVLLDELTRLVMSYIPVI